jgi:Co/Zn/Cd efflux system component
MSAHAVVSDAAPPEETTQALHDLAHERFGIEHATIQLEPTADRAAGNGG